MTKDQEKRLTPLLKKLIMEAKTELNEGGYDSAEFQKFEQNFIKFTQQLAILSKKYGIALDVTGGISYGNIVSIKYSHDLSSGDLQSYVRWEGE